MISNYMSPQTQLFQKIETPILPNDSTQDAFIYGVAFDLYRANFPAERETITPTVPGAQDANQLITIHAGGIPVDRLITDVALWGEGLHADLSEGTSLGATEETGFSLLSASPSAKKIYYHTTTVAAVPATPAGPALAVGDLVTVTVKESVLPGASVERTVVGFEALNGVERAVIVLDGIAAPVVATGEVAVADEQLSITAIRRPWSGFISSEEYTVSETNNTLTVLSGLVLKVDALFNGVSVVVGKGQFYPSYKLRHIPASVQEPVRVTSSAEINETFGVIDPENPVAFGLATALQAAQGAAVWGYKVADDTEEAFAAAANLAERYKNLVYHAPMTENEDAFKAIALSMSNASTFNRKRFRRAYLGASAKAKRSVTLAGSTVVTTGDDASKILSVAGNWVGADNFVTLGIAPGDIIETDIHGASIVEQVLSENEVMVTDVFGIDIDGEEIRIYRGDTVAAHTDYLVGLQKSLSNRRVNLVWSHRPTAIVDDVITELSNMYGAAELAGTKAKGPANLGLSRYELSVFSDVSNMRTKWSDVDLDNLAKNGIFLVTQDYKKGPIYVRHQLTTDTEQGPIGWEDSVGSAADVISFALLDAVEGYIGKTNASQVTVNRIYDVVKSVLLSFTTSGSSVSSGPYIEDFNPEEDLSVEIDPVFRDRVNIKVILRFPLPLNVVIFELNLTQTVA